MITNLLTLALLAKPQITAWVVSSNPTSIKGFAEHADRFNAVFTDYYAMTAAGLPIRHDQNAPAFNQVRAIAKKHKVEFYAMVNNYTDDKGIEDFDPLRLSKALATAESRLAFASGLVKLVKQDGAGGVDLDLESIKGDDRDRYTAFVTLLSKLLHRDGLKLSVTVQAKDEVVGSWDGVRALDYKALGAAADRFNIMTYDFSWSTGPEGPIAPNDWVERVIKFGASQMPPSKVAMGIACYGYDWSKKPASNPEWADFKKLPYTLDPKSGEYVSGKSHYSGLEAFQQKYQMAAKLGVGSIAFWFCGSEDPKVWEFLPTRK